MSQKPILCPLPGTFYRRPSPDAEPFVKEGDAVEPDTVIGVVELMKQFTHIEAGCAGTISHFEVGDGDVVDGDQPVAVVNLA